jgi:hypothetical protein
MKYEVSRANDVFFLQNGAPQGVMCVHTVVHASPNTSFVTGDETVHLVTTNVIAWQWHQTDSVRTPSSTTTLVC